MDGKKPRKIIEDALFRECCARIKPDAKRMDEALWAATWALAKDAELVSWAIPETGLRILLTDPFPDVPALRLYLVINDEEALTLVWVEPVPDGA